MAIRDLRLCQMTTRQEHRRHLPSALSFNNRVLRQAVRVMPVGVEVVVLADRGLADGKLMKYLRETLQWHFRIRIKRSFAFQFEGEWRQVSSVHLEAGPSLLHSRGVHWQN